MEILGVDVSRNFRSRVTWILRTKCHLPIRSRKRKYAGATAAPTTKPPVVQPLTSPGITTVTSQAVSQSVVHNVPNMQATVVTQTSTTSGKERNSVVTHNEESDAKTEPPTIFLNTIPRTISTDSSMTNSGAPSTLASPTVQTTSATDTSGITATTPSAGTPA